MSGDKKIHIPKRRKRIEHWKVIAAYLVVYDIVAVNASYFCALWLRFDMHFSSIPDMYLRSFLKFTPFYTIFCLAVFAGLRLYNSLWRFASISELNRVISASVITTIFQVVGITVFIRRMPVSYYIFGAVLQFGSTLVVRFSYRYITLERSRRDKNQQATHRAMIIGAGSAGQVIIRELKRANGTEAIPVCVIDDNSNKWGRLIEGIPIVGGRYDIMDMVVKYRVDRIIYAIPATTGKNRKEILNLCKESGCKMQTVPGVYQLVNGEVSVTSLRDVEITDLLGRAQVKVNNDEIFQAIKGKTVLVTGGGGSIGSELCRQIAKAEPKRLIIFDIYENNAYEIQQELKRKYKDKLDMITLIGSVRNTKRISWVMETYRPEVVYHAAAHKHVPLMEDSPNEAIKNNVLGTYKTAQAAVKYGVKKFVLISTDKAVNPTNIMGASKRLCEMVVQMMNRQTPDTDFVAVRFGNVLGSNGSVIPLFKKQIAEGGPVTVTDKNIIRYFMTIPEAVSLVLQASYYAKGGEIFVLDMGEPVKIDDMARNLIRLSGYTPDVDIPIVYTGLRPGEKLYEELLMDEEGMRETENELIYIGKPIEMDDEDFREKLEVLDRESKRESGRIKEIVAEIVPTYHPKEESTIESEAV